jgi:hypothetical protein
MRGSIPAQFVGFHAPIVRLLSASLTASFCAPALFGIGSPQHLAWASLKTGNFRERRAYSGVILIERFRQLHFSTCAAASDANAIRLGVG